MKKNIALVAGGFTGESVISLNSAKQIEKNLDSSIYNVFMIEINNDGWFYRSADQRLSSVDKNDFSITDSGKKINFDCAFIIVHGTPGEDGKLQGYFDLIGLPYTSCDTTTSAITMNKAYTKVLVNDTPNLYTAKSLQLFSIEDYRLKSLQESKVSDWYHLDEAIAKAFKEGSEVLIEEFIQGREFSVGIYKVKGNINVLPITEIKTSKEFFDYEAKYTDGVTEEITPADLDQNIVNKVHAIVKDVYKKLNCKGMIRIDFILEQQKNDFYFIEVNTTPGQSENSIIPQQVRAEGNNMKNFYGLLVEEALTVK
jgi:D-alanine-D-alanine ligase